MANNPILLNSAAAVVRDLQRFGAVMDADRRKILEYAAVPLVAAMQQRAPVGDKVHKRYSGGKAVATYHPGNLRRSLQVLHKLKRTERLFVGARKDGKRGTFGRARFDPYYGGWVNRGTSRTRARPFIEPAVAAASQQVRRRIELGLQVTIKKFNAKK